MRAWAFVLTASCSSDPIGEDAGDGGPARDSSIARDAEPDAGAGEPDAEADAGSTDAGPLDTGCVPTSTAATSTSAPRWLSETGLYDDIATKRLAPGVEWFAPAHALWSDGAAKERWVALPECAPIDTSDMDHWRFPAGTRFFKEFSLGGVRLETRLVARYGDGPDDFFFATYQWNDAETEAELLRFGARNVKGTMHDIPAASACRSCHAHLPERILGFGAVQLGHDGPGVTIEGLIAAGRLTAPPRERYTIPGDAATKAALGYLHANCGNCHFADVPGGIEFLDPFDLRLRFGARTATATAVFATAVGVSVEKFVDPGVVLRIAPGDAATSGVFVRMSQRGNLDQMPPIASEIVDPTGLMIVEAWIESL